GHILFDHNYMTSTHMTDITIGYTVFCNFCIRKYGSVGTTQVKPECYTSNRARLCHNYLIKCDNFHEYNTSEEVQTILKLPILEDKKKCKELNKNDN
ncbi:8484_t:CDS:2, partial [Diversispora eburnea]